MAMVAIAFGLMLNGPASVTGVTGFRLGGRPAQDVFTNPQTASLAKATCTGSVSKINALVKNGADVNGRGEKGITPLIWAMNCHSLEGVLALLKAGANPNQATRIGAGQNQSNSDGVTAVYLAAGRHDARTLSILLKYGGNPNAVYNPNYFNKYSALMNAVGLDRVQNMKLLLTYGANVNLHDGEGSAPGHGFSVLVYAGHRFDMVLYMLQHAQFTRDNLQQYADYYLSGSLPNGFIRPPTIRDIKADRWLALYAKIISYFKNNNIFPHNKGAPPPRDLANTTLNRYKIFWRENIHSSP
ncbi:MAG: ankyrin repeat domain-containing protein [Acidithiobacillus sp.]